MASHIERRKFLATLGGGAVAWPLAARAQQPGKIYRIAILTAGNEITPASWKVFSEALRALGWIEGKNVVFERYLADNRLDRLAEIAAELAHLNFDVIVTVGTLAPLAAKRATATIPIVMQAAGDPLGSGLVASLARPGGNVTGLSLMAPDLAGKRLEILREILREISLVAVLWNVANPYPALVFKQTEVAAKTLGIEVQSLEVRGPGDFDNALEAAVRRHATALIAVEDPLTFGYRKQITDFAAKNRLPAIYGLREFVDAGGFIAYGAHILDLWRRSTGYVDKILRGAKPSDLPVEQPTKFELVINLKTANALGLTVPPTLLARADEVIE